MPFYTYRAIKPEASCDHCLESFETLQSIKSDAMTECPKCHNPIVRLIQPVGFVQDTSEKKILSDENLKKHGFKKLVNAGGGKFDEVV